MEGCPLIRYHPIGLNVPPVRNNYVLPYLVLHFLVNDQPTGQIIVILLLSIKFAHLKCKSEKELRVVHHILDIAGDVALNIMNNLCANFVLFGALGRPECINLLTAIEHRLHDVLGLVLVQLQPQPLREVEGELLILAVGHVVPRLLYLLALQLDLVARLDVDEAAVGQQLVVIEELNAVL